MKKNIKFLFILTMFLVLIINTYCFAIDMNLTMNNQTGNNELEVQTNQAEVSAGRRRTDDLGRSGTGHSQCAAQCQKSFLHNDNNLGRIQR